MTVKYFFFPFKRKPSILYSDENICKSKIFDVLYYSMFSNIFIANLFRIKAIRIIIGLFFYKKINVPTKAIKLIYNGYDNTIGFEFNEQYEIEKVYKIHGYNVFKEDVFLGYPLGYKNYDEFIVHKSILCDFLKDHWFKLKNCKVSLHGDMQLYNVLINNNKISLIDNFPTSNSIIFDHFYYYTSVLHCHKRNRPFSSANYLKLEEVLNEIYRNIFRFEDKLYIKTLIDNISLKNDRCKSLNTKDIKNFKKLFL